MKILNFKSQFKNLKIFKILVLSSSLFKKVYHNGICVVEGENLLKERRVQYWFKKFKSASYTSHCFFDFLIKNKQHIKPLVPLNSFSLFRLLSRIKFSKEDTGGTSGIYLVKLNLKSWNKLKLKVLCKLMSNDSNVKKTKYLIVIFNLRK